MNASISKDIRESLKKELDKGIEFNQERLKKLEETKNYLLSIDHDISKTLAKQICHLSEKYPQASSNAIKNIRKVILPEVMNRPKFLMCKNSARIDPIMEKTHSQKAISKFLSK